MSCWRLSIDFLTLFHVPVALGSQHLPFKYQLIKPGYSWAPPYLWTWIILWWRRRVDANYNWQVGIYWLPLTMPTHSDNYHSLSTHTDGWISQVRCWGKGFRLMVRSSSDIFRPCPSIIVILVSWWQRSIFPGAKYIWLKAHLFTFNLGKVLLPPVEQCASTRTCRGSGVRGWVQERNGGAL